MFRCFLKSYFTSFYLKSNIGKNIFLIITLNGDVREHI